MKKMIIGLKIEAFRSFAECARVIRKFHHYSFSDLKTRIQEHEYILCYSCTDPLGVKNVISCYEQLILVGADVSLYELDDRLTTIEHVRNRDKMYDEISSDVDADINDEDQKE